VARSSRVVGVAGDGISLARSHAKDRHGRIKCSPTGQWPKTRGGASGACEWVDGEGEGEGEDEGDGEEGGEGMKRLVLWW
jgi:hypothetical protein